MRIVLLTCLLLAGWGSPVQAHGLGWQSDPAPAMVVLFTYAGGEPMAYASIKVFAPNEAEVEYQNAHTDKTGRFAIVPGAAGPWRIVADDGMGHRQEAVLDVAAPQAASGASANMTTPPQTSSTGTSFVLRLALGLSVLGNIFCGLYGLRKRKNEVLQ
ncbi:hypothetical protein [Desulfovibrio cuneatus]|uniref:hypothetical protein n=1 Tax=Desulfovibrio cuneatus TaxID=159728 RepID=UPI0003F4E04C|nr:hypothetical protein [Desulfovibrio cuneatus]